MARDRPLSRLALAAQIRLSLRAITGGRLRAATFLMNASQACPGFFALELVAGEPARISLVRLRFREGQCRLGLNRHLPELPRLDFMTRRLIGVLPLLAACRGLPDGETGLNLDDIGVAPGLAFSAAGPDYHLVPDPIYLTERGYRRSAQRYRKCDPPWADRKPIAFWRGSTTGTCPPGDWRSLPRARLCEMAARRPDLFDVGFGAVVQQAPADCAAIRDSGYPRPPVPELDFIHYRYQIDIDGNSNSWSGLFIKLLTGSPVLKVESALGFRQWYYDRLTPWVNFVPVAPDMADLAEKVEWLIAHDSEAQRIGAAGRALALSIDMRGELRLARGTVAAALSAGLGHAGTSAKDITGEDA